MARRERRRAPQRSAEPPAVRADVVQALFAETRGDARLQRLLEQVDEYETELRAQHAQLLQAQAALEASRDRYSDLFLYAPVGYASLDRNGLIEEVNLAAARLLGTAPRHTVSMPFMVFVAEPDRRRFLQHMHKCRMGAFSVVTELTLKTPAARSLPVELHSRPMAAEHDRRSFVTALFDLTDLKRAEEKRRVAEEERQRGLREEAAARARDEAKDRFLATLSHELRTPLTPILFALATIEAHGQVPDGLRFNLAMIRRNVQHEARLIDDLLDLTRIARDKVHLRSEVVDVHVLLDDLVTATAEEARQAGLEVALGLGARRHHVRGDPTRLRQIFWNVLNNAIRYTPPGGRIAIDTHAHAGRVVRVTVKDTGAGMAPEMLPRVFSPFEQADERGRGRAGLGLGLAICRGLVQAHGGTIGADSPGPGKGSTFTVEIPLVAPEDVPASDARPSGPPVAHPTTTILLVEDDPDSAAALEHALRIHGYTVRLAHSVHEALAPADGVDVVISDIGLPDGSGLDVMRSLRARRPVRGIALSGYGSESDMAASRAAGFDRHLVKPIDVEMLLREIASLAASA